MGVWISYLKGSGTNQDSVENNPREYRSHWFMGINNVVDNSHQSLVNPKVTLESSLDLTEFNPINPDKTEPVPGSYLYTWDFFGEEVPELWSLMLNASEFNNISIETPRFSASRTVTPEILSYPPNSQTEQTVTIILTLEEPLPSEVNHFVVNVGTERVVYRELSLIDTEVVSQNAVEGWVNETLTPYEARWVANAPFLPEKGTTYTFEVTFLTTKSEQLLGSPIFKPWVVIFYMQNENIEPIASESITLDHSAAASATFTAENQVTWQPHIETIQYSFSFDRIISEIVGEEPPFSVKVDADVDIDPNTLNLKSKGRWITAYVRLPEGYDVADISAENFILNGELQAEWNDIQDGVLMAKFNRADVTAILEVGNEVEVWITGGLTDGTLFEGSDIIRVIEKGK